MKTKQREGLDCDGHSFDLVGPIIANSTEHLFPLELRVLTGLLLDGNKQRFHFQYLRSIGNQSMAAIVALEIIVAFSVFLCNLM